VVIFTGGTIAMLPDERIGGAAVPSLRGSDVLGRTPGLARIAQLEAVDWGLVPASHLRFSQLLEIGALIGHATSRDDIAGVVVVQGTDVLEETAFAWDLLPLGDTPVVVVGAMRNAGEPDYDGPRNLADALRVAVDPRLRGQGVVVVMDGLILPADDAVKTDSQALDTFQAPNVGALGRVVDGRVLVARARGTRRVLPDVPAHAAEPIALLSAVVSTDGDLLRAAVAGGAVGVVVEATGSGNTDPDLLAAAVEAMAQGVPVVLTTRCGSGAVGPFYGFPGGGRTWQEAGAIMAGSLSGPKARVALALGMGAGLDRPALDVLIGGTGGRDVDGGAGGA
jgi:L-asparaginase